LLNIIDISFYSNNECDELAVLLQQHDAALAYVNYLEGKAGIQVVKHLNKEQTVIINSVKYSGFKSHNAFWHIPFKTIDYIKKEKPDIVIVQGFVFPVQMIWLRMKLGKQCVIMVQHHGENPFKGIKQWIQKIAGKFIDGYLFTSMDNAQQWIAQKIIKNRDKCFELLEASTHFRRQDKLLARQQLQLNGDFNFLWVGRLNEGKDPLTVIKAFETYSSKNHEAKLLMIYQTEELLPQIKKILDLNTSLQHKIILIGRVEHTEMERWYNAADFFISGSHFEGSGYALIEAMACGCIPIVTNIPSFNKITRSGGYGFLYEAGNPDDLMAQLSRLNEIDRDKMSGAIEEFFMRELSFRSIADDLYTISKKLTRK
jgi:glycosyltransferase involved in cell wall biosynthesis